MAQISGKLGRKAYDTTVLYNLYHVLDRVYYYTPVEATLIRCYYLNIRYLDPATASLGLIEIEHRPIKARLAWTYILVLNGVLD